MMDETTSGFVAEVEVKGLTGLRDGLRFFFGPQLHLPHFRSNTRFIGCLRGRFRSGLGLAMHQHSRPGRTQQQSDQSGENISDILNDILQRWEQKQCHR